MNVFSEKKTQSGCVYKNKAFQKIAKKTSVVFLLKTIKQHKTFIAPLTLSQKKLFSFSGIKHHENIHNTL